MIQAKDLRIGNLIHLNGCVYPVDLSIIGTIIEFPDKAKAEIQPIQLHEIWLKKFDFFNRQDSIWYYRDIKKVGVFSIIHGKNDFGSRFSRLWVVSGTTGKQFKYVHQLQNLFFALTGEELNIQ